MKNRFELKNDYLYLVEKYRKYIMIDNGPGLKYCSDNGIELKTLYLMPMENNLTAPDFFNKQYIADYFKGYISANSRFAHMMKPLIETHYLQYAFLNDEYYELSNFIPYEHKIKGIACLNKIYHTNGEGDIIYLREDVINNLNLKIKHVYCNDKSWKTNWTVKFMNEGTDPYSNASLQIRNKYMFNLALETVYNPLWSQDWITERIFNCFKAKTIPLYLGAYNIEDYIPKDLFIDLRDYIIQYSPTIVLNYTLLSERLNDLMNDRQRYNDMTEAAYQWQLNNKFGNFKTFERKLDRIIGYKNE
jgi:hypothetical protein